MTGRTAWSKWTTPCGRRSPCFSGTIPALLNRTIRIDVVVYYLPMSQQGDQTVGYVQGRRAHDMTASGLFGHGLSQFNAGDTITPLFDFCDANGIYQETLQGDPIAMRERPGAESSHRAAPACPENRTSPAEAELVQGTLPTPAALEGKERCRRVC
jgi:hypothetical protein